MNEDLISRKALRRKLIDRQITTVFYDNAKRHEVGCIIEMLDNAPAVDAEKVCEQMGLVKEAFEMAKVDLVAVCRCKDCEAWQTKTAMSFLRDGVHVRCCSCGVYGRLMYEDDFCSKGKRRADA